MEKVYTKDFQVSYAQMEQSFVVKPSALFNFLQDMASWHAEALGFGYSQIYPQNLAWFLLKYRAEFDEYPSNTFNLTVVTEPRGYHKKFAYRDFWINDGQRCLGRVSSLWTIVNTQTGALISPQELNHPLMGELAARSDDLSFGKIPLPAETNLVKNFDVRYEDVDINGHVNNVEYIILAFEVLDCGFRSSHRLKTLDVAFKKEVKYGAKIVSEAVFTAADTTCHVLKDLETDSVLCRLQAVWERMKANRTLF